NAANAIGNTMQGIGQAQASGIVGSANAITGGINSAANNTLLYNYLNKNPSGYGSSSFSGPSYGGGNALTDSYGGSSSNPLAGLDASDYGSGYAIGGLVHAIHSIHKTIKRSRGGAVNAATPFQSFDDGGTASFDDRFAPAIDNPFVDLSRNQAINYL